MVQNTITLGLGFQHVNFEGHKHSVDTVVFRRVQDISYHFIGIYKNGLKNGYLICDISIFQFV